MATITPTVTDISKDGTAYLFVWVLGNADDGAPIGDAHIQLSDCCVDAIGTFGAATVVFEGSNGGVTYGTLNNVQGTPISSTVALIPKQVVEVPPIQAAENERRDRHVDHLQRDLPQTTTSEDMMSQSDIAQISQSIENIRKISLFLSGLHGLDELLSRLGSLLNMEEESKVRLAEINAELAVAAELLETSTGTARKMTDTAQQQADQILEAAHAGAGKIVEKAKTDAEAVLTEARARADEITTAAQEAARSGRDKWDADERMARDVLAKIVQETIEAEARRDAVKSDLAATEKRIAQIKEFAGAV